MNNCKNCKWCMLDEGIPFECNNYSDKDVMKYYIEILAFDFELFNSGNAAINCKGYEEK